jgi:hypothetical protein
MSTYYLISSLPTLSLDVKPTLTLEEYISLCRAQLGSADAEAIEALLSDQTSRHPFVAAWRDKETILKNAIAYARATISNADVEPWIRPTQGCDLSYEVLVDEVFQRADPLQREKGLDNLRWSIAESLQAYDPMDVTIALAYAIKLKLAWRWASLNTEKGQAAFEQLTTYTLNSDGSDRSGGSDRSQGATA